MKLSKLVNEVNQEQELLQLCDKLVADLLEEHLKQYPTLTEYSYEYKVSRKYIKIISLNFIILLLIFFVLSKVIDLLLNFLFL